MSKLKTLVVHDLDIQTYQRLFAPRFEGAIVIRPDERILHCTGCFGCWVSQPAHCILKDSYNDMPALLGASSDLVLISACVYGGFSPLVKNVLDRSIGYVHPYFTRVQGRMHHQQRYPKVMNVHAGFYGPEVLPEEQTLARKLVAANCVNLYGTVRQVTFARMPDELAEVF